MDEIASLQLKDWLSIGFSTVALILSIVALVRSVLEAGRERDRKIIDRRQAVIAQMAALQKNLVVQKRQLKDAVWQGRKLSYSAVNEALNNQLSMIDGALETHGKLLQRLTREIPKAGLERAEFSRTLDEAQLRFEELNSSVQLEFHGMMLDTFRRILETDKEAPGPRE